MRLLLAIALFLLLLWLQNAQTPNCNAQEEPCEAATMIEAAVSLLLSPLSLLFGLACTLLRLVLSIPALFLSSLQHSLLLLLAWPWCVASFCVSLLLTCFRVVLYLLHLALVFGVVVILTLTLHKNSTTTNEKVLQKKGKVKRPQTKTRLKMFVRRIVQQG